VLLVGLVFGLSGIRPVPAIVAAQALNGILLPVVSVFLLVTINDRKLMGEAANRSGSNLVMSVVTLVTLLLGTAGVLRAATAALGRPAPGPFVLLAATALVVGVVAIPVVRSFRS
jgi:Mn2+/Fe2+ NRAMP family transporter